jgi:hypothetical protein
MDSEVVVCFSCEGWQTPPESLEDTELTSMIIGEYFPVYINEENPIALAQQRQIILSETQIPHVFNFHTVQRMNNQFAVFTLTASGWQRDLSFEVAYDNYTFTVCSDCDATIRAFLNQKNYAAAANEAKARGSFIPRGSELEVTEEQIFCFEMPLSRGSEMPEFNCGYVSTNHQMMAWNYDNDGEPVWVLAGAISGLINPLEVWFSGDGTITVTNAR